MRKAGFVTVVIFLQRRVRNGSIFWLIAVDGNGNDVLIQQEQAVITHSGTSKITCRAQVTPSLTAQGAVHWSFANTGFECFTEPPFHTQHWEEVVTPSGQATLSCQFNESSN